MKQIISIKQNDICWTARVEMFDGSIVGIDYNEKPTAYKIEADVNKMYRIARED